MPTRPRKDSSRPHPLLRLVLCLFALQIGVASAHAIPAFARRYELPCHFCHDGYPKLSVLGEQFKERGYRLDEDVTDLSDWARSVPGSLRGTLRQTFEENGDADTRGLFKLVSAGNLGSRWSYWVDEGEIVDGDGLDRVGVDNAFLRFEILEGELYARGGRFELDLPFTQARSPQLFAYSIYFANTGFETDTIGQHQDGIEVGGFVDERTRWSFAVVKGQNSELQESLTRRADRFDGNVFGRLMRRFGEGRAGAYVYWGRNVLSRQVPRGSEEPENEVLVWEDDLLRLGADGAIYIGPAHLYGTVLYGRNGNAFADASHPNGTEEASSYAGAFAQLDFNVRDELVLSSRLDVVRSPLPQTAGPSETFVGFFPGLKLWLHPRVRLAFELGFRNRDLPTQGAIHLEAVF